MILNALLQSGDEFLRHHQVGAVAHHHVDLALGGRHLGADAAGDLVAHAGVAVLEVESAGLFRAPEFVQVAGQAARGADHHVFRLRELVYNADDVTLPQRNGLGGSRLAVGFRQPTSARQVSTCALKAAGTR